MTFFSGKKVQHEKARQLVLAHLEKREAFDLSQWSLHVMEDAQAPGILRVRVKREMRKPMHYFDVFVLAKSMTVVGEADTGMHFPR
jgi:cell fate regulator YaaT (PSP1 superfamily)